MNIKEIHLELKSKEELIESITRLITDKFLLTKEKDALYNALITTRTKYNNDKARYRRKAKRYRNILNGLEEWCKDGIKDELFKFDYGTKIIGEPIKIHITSYEMVLDRIQELRRNINDRFY